jgi:hypothetical protein
VKEKKDILMGHTRINFSHYHYLEQTYKVQLSFSSLS